MNLRDITIRNALLYPNKEALVFNERRVSHQEMAARSFRLANALIGLGLRQQERVAMLAPNCCEYLEVFGACESANLIIVNMNHRLSSRELIQIVHDCEPVALIFHDQFRGLAEELIAALPGLRRIICIEGSREGEADYEELLQSAPSTPPQVPIRDSDVAYLIYTSGTTGKPKGVMLSHRAVAESARCISHEGGARLLRHDVDRDADCFISAAALSSFPIPLSARPSCFTPPSMPAPSSARSKKSG